jgi:hypothetical protein
MTNGIVGMSFTLTPETIMSWEWLRTTETFDSEAEEKPEAPHGHIQTTLRVTVPPRVKKIDPFNPKSSKNTIKRDFPIDFNLLKFRSLIYNPSIYHMPKPPQPQPQQIANKKNGHIFANAR